MTNEYLYGTYGDITDTISQSAVKSGTSPVYVGAAPVNLIRGYAGRGIVNAPVMVTGMADAQRRLGYSADWAAFTLCEAMAAHFDNAVGNIGPAFLINVLDPAVHKKEEPTERNLIFSAGRAEIVSDTIILDSLALTDCVEGEDYSVSYDFTRKTAVITSMDGDSPLSGSISATFDEVDPSRVREADIIGGATSEGEYKGIRAIALLYPEQNVVPNLIAAPGWSHIPGVYQAMLAAAHKINGHWDAFVLADIPVADSTGAVDTIEKAVAWKQIHGYNGERSKVFWPSGIDAGGRVFHYSSLAAAELMRIDNEHGSVPMETCGNKPVPVVRNYFGPGSKNRGFDQDASRVLTSNGISTAVFWGGRFVLWGDHTAAFAFNSDTNPRAIFDVSMRMLMHITNLFQLEWGLMIDRPMDRNLKDRILNREQEKLDAYVSMGALIGRPQVLFLPAENSTASLMNGDFRWDIPVTPTPPLKSATIGVAYTDAGFATYFEEED